MRKLTTAIVGLGLLVGSTVSANDAFEAFYPEANNDTPDYLERKVSLSNPTHVLAKVSISKETLKAFYPEAENDSPDYISSTSLENDISTHTLHQSTLSKETLNALYPEANSDTPDYLI